jgi:hypothetical protein
MSDHSQPYAPLTAPLPTRKVAAHVFVSAEMLDEMGPGVDELWRSYRRAREFNRLRHPNPFPRFRPFRWLP